MFYLLVCTMLCFPLGDGGKDLEAMQGTWIPSAGEMEGQPIPEELRKSIKLVIEKDRYHVTVGEQDDKGTVKINDTAKPKTLDIQGKEGPNKGKTILAIYELDGDTLKVCYDLSGKARPTAFKTKPGTLQFFATYQRQKR